MATFEVLDGLMEITGSTKLHKRMRFWFVQEIAEEEGLLKLLRERCDDLRRKSARRRVLIREMEALGDRGVNGDLVSSVASASSEGPIPPKTTKQKLDAKSLWEVIKNRFGGNKESKKMQKTILNTNETVNTAHGVSTSSSKDQASTASYADDVMFSFFTNQSNASQLDYEDLEQIDTDDLKEMDLKWQVAMLTMRIFQSEEELTNFALMAHTSSLDFETGLGYDGHVNKSEVLNNVVDSCESDGEDNQLNDVFKKSEGYHAVPPPYTRNYMPPRANLSFVGLDNSVFKSKVSENIISVPKIETNASKTSKDSLEKPKTVMSSAPIIEDWESDSEDENVFEPKKGNPQYALQDQEIFNSGCSRHMIGNKCYLTDYQEIDDGFFIGYSINSKAFRVFNIRTKTIEENLHINFIKNKPNVARTGPNWMFDIDTLTMSMNYRPVFVKNQTNGNAGSKANINAGQARKKTITGPHYVLLQLLTTDSQGPTSSKDEVADDAKKKSTEVLRKKNGVQDPTKEGDKNNQEKDIRNKEETPRKKFEQESKWLFGQREDANTYSTNSLNTVTSPVNIVSSSFTTIDPGRKRAQMNEFESMFGQEKDANGNRIFTPLSAAGSTYVYLGGLSLLMMLLFLMLIFLLILSCLIWRILLIFRILESLVVHMMMKLRKVWRLVDLPKGKHVNRTKWVYKNKKDKRGIVVRNKARLVAQGYTKEEGIDYDKVFTSVARIEAIRIFLAYALFIGFIVYQMDVKSAFLYGTIEEEVYVCQPSGFEYPHFPNKVYKVEKALYGLHQAPRAWINAQEVPDEFYGGAYFLLRVASHRIFRYLKGQPKLGLWYPRDSPFDLKAFSDSDYAGASLDRKSTTRGCQFLRKRLILWQCKKQKLVANSTTEAEYVAVVMNWNETAANDEIQASIVGLTYYRPYAYFSQTSMVNLEFYDTHNMVVYLQKPEESEEFHQIMDFLNTSHIRYALTENPTIYVSLIYQFWQTATTRTFDNREMEITATIDGKVKVVTEASVRRNLKLEDLEGPIFQGEGSTVLVESHHIPTDAPSTSPPHLLSPPRSSIRQETEVPQPSSPTHTLVVDEAASTDRVLALEADLKQTKKVYGDAYTKLIMKVKKLEKTVKTSQAKRKAKIVKSDEEVNLEDPSKQGRNTTRKNRRRAVSTSSGGVSTASRMISTFEESVSTAGALMLVSIVGMVDKGKGIMEESESDVNKTKRKQAQERLGLETTMRLQEPFEKEERKRMARVHIAAQTFTKKEWEKIKARVEANEELTQRLQAEKRDKYSEVDQAKMLVDLINQRKRYFAKQKAKEKRKKSMTQAQQRTYMSNYIKHIGSYTLKQLKKLSFDEIKELFKATMRSINDFVPMKSEDDKAVPKLLEARSLKRDAEEELDQGKSKKQKIGKSS
nr:putative ribonuclease H-like domain-containing protein [Tanacetum cinerariifolium]